MRSARKADPIAVPVSRFVELGTDRATLDGLLPATGGSIDGLLLLGRDALDVQVVDTAGRRLARVGDVDLAWDAGVLRAIAVDVGWRAILHRLGLRRLAHRASRDGIDWAGLHLASGPGHALQLASPGAAVHRLDPDDLAELLTRLPPARGGEVLTTVAAARAAAALGAVHPELSADLVEVLTPARAVELLAQMTDDAAAAALRGADSARREGLLDAIDDERAERLRTLLLRSAAPAADAPRAPRRYRRVLRGRRGARR